MDMTLTAISVTHLRDQPEIKVNAAALFSSWVVLYLEIAFPFIKSTGLVLAIIQTIKID